MLDSEGLRKCAFVHQYVYLAVWCHWQFFFFISLSFITYIALAQKQKCILHWILNAPDRCPLLPFFFELLGFSDCSLCFCFSCLWYLPSSSSSGLPQSSHGCPECKVVWCWSLLLVGVMFLFVSGVFPTFCYGLYCLSSCLRSSI